MADKRKSGISAIKLLVWWLILMPILIIGAPAIIIIAVGMIPTFISWVVEDDPDLPATLSIACFNACGTVPFLLQLMLKHYTIPMTLRLFYDPYTWLIMYGAAFMGYSIYWGVPRIVLSAMRLSSRLRIKKLKHAQKELLKEWGEILLPDQRPAELLQTISVEEEDTPANATSDQNDEKE